MTIDATKRSRAKTIRFALPVLAAAVLLLGGVAVHAAQAPEQQASSAFGGMYRDLQPEQRRVFDDFIAGYNEVMAASLGVESSYDEMPASTRSTFEAITDALGKTTLSDAEGNALGTALELVAVLERVNGAILGAGGDLQFRAYVELTPNARDVLDRSVEFKRERDNTRYHKGYPLSYRLLDGPPSVQFSMSADATRADIDIDYRSSGIPEVLWDGHLTMANSDVRAGGNYDRHVGRWEGLQDWWTALFGFFKKEDAATEDVAGPDTSVLTPIAVVPRIDPGADLSSTVTDFLTAWLLEGAPDVALAHLSPATDACVLELQEHAQAGAWAPQYTLNGMQGVNASLGGVSDLSAVAQPVPVSNVRMRQQRHANEELFALVTVPADVIGTLGCRTPGDPPRRAAGNQSGHASSVRITAPTGESVDLFILWEQQGDYWKIVAYHVNVAFDAATTLAVAAPAETLPSLPVAAPDDEFLGVVDAFLTQWLVQGSTEHLDRLVAARCYACVDLLHSDAEPSGSEGEARRRLRAGFEGVAEAVAPARSLGEAIRASEPWNPELHLMPHGNADAYTVVAVPEHLATAFECTNRAVGMQPQSDPGAGEYGDYYAVLFQLAGGGEHLPTFMLLWARERGEWQVVSYDVLVD